MGVTRRPNGKYRARVLGDDGRERARHFDRKVDAQRWEREQLAARDRGQFVDSSNRITVTEYARQWAATRPHRPSTARVIKSLIDNHIAPTPLGSRRLVALRPSEVQAWATSRVPIMAPTRLRQAVSMLRAMYEDAVIDRLVGSNPVVRRIKIPTVERERVIPLTVEQVATLANAMPDRNRAMVIVQATTGLRVAELLALRVQDVDFLRRDLRVEFQLDSKTTERIAPKTPRSKRVIPLPQTAADALAAYLAKYPAGKDGTIFATSAGKPYLQLTYWRIFGRAAEKVGLDVTSHILRHTYASTLLEAGESMIVVAERLGHANATQVATTYGHIMPNSEDRTRRAIDAAWSEVGLNTDQGRGVGL